MLTTKRTRFFFYLLAIVLLGLGALTHVEAATKAKPFTYTRIFYYREGPLARESLFTYPSSIDVLGPQSYALDATGALTGSIDPDILAFAEKHNIKVMPLVTNGAFSQDSYQMLLNDTNAQDTAVVALVSEAKKNSYWGWQIDFEQMDASYHNKFSTFVQRMADAMKKNNLVASVAVIAKVSDTPNDYPNDLWQKTIGVYDYAPLAASVDFVTVMSYDDPNSEGPVVEYAWLLQVLDYSTKLIPHDKLSLGIPLYYWHWNDTTGARIGVGGRKGIYNVFKKHRVTVHYSAKEQAPYLAYWNHTQHYLLWYENGQSIKKKISLIKKYQLHGFSAWALGLELPSIYGAIR